MMPHSSARAAIRAVMRPIGHLLALSALFAVVQVHAAGRVFFDDFESGGTSKWTFVGNNRASVVSIARDGKGPAGGSKMLEGNWDGTVPWNDPRNRADAQLASWSYNKEFLIRMWIRYDADVDRKGGNKLLRVGGGGQMFYMAGQVEVVPPQMFMYFESMAGVSGPRSYSGGIAGDGKWHKLEIYIKHNTNGLTDGTVRVWNDGVKQIDSTNVKTVSPGQSWVPLNLVSNWSNNPGWEHDANNHVYFDDIEIFSDTGTGGSGSLADATISGGIPGPITPLTAPKNLR